MTKPRVLHCITVYNGRAIVPQALRSAMRMDRSVADFDVLILDDASPEPGWSADLKALCEELGALYYLTPRNLGIPRNVSLGLNAAVTHGYDYVTINNSDVLFPKNFISGMVTGCLQNPGVGSITASSNNVSIYSVPNEDPDRFIGNQETVDWISSVAQTHFPGTVIDIPAGISFAIIMPIDAIRTVGVMDPIFGRGYCEETDWSLRSLQAGLRLTMAPGVFVYHQGRGSNLEAGLVSEGHTSVPENEAIIDLRYPNFRREVDAYFRSGRNSWEASKLIHELHDYSARADGVHIEVGSIVPVGDGKGLQVRVSSRNNLTEVVLAHKGFIQTLHFDSEKSAVDFIEARFGQTKVYVVTHDHSPVAVRLRTAFPTNLTERAIGYPMSV